MNRFKLSISLLAIVVAVSSAFTTKRVLTDQTWFELGTPVISSTYTTQGTTVGNFDYLPTYANVVPVHVETAADDCPFTSGRICAAKIPQFTNGNATQLEQSDLDGLGATAPSGSAIKFMNP